jgi:CoA-transferase family III
MDFNYYSANLGMRSAIMDFRRPDEMARFHRLATGADIFFANRRPGLLEKLRITSSELARLRHGISKSISRSMGLLDPGPTGSASIIRLAAFPGCSRSGAPSKNRSSPRSSS